MAGVYFGAMDIYGGGTDFTTNSTIPDSDDQTALVDTQQANNGQKAEAKKTPVYLAFLLIAIIALVLGVMNR